MTREEAIKELKIFSGTTRIRLSANFWEALNTVIKALEQETCEDAVSRQSVKDGMIKYGFHASDMTATEFVEDVLQPLITHKKENCEMSAEGYRQRMIQAFHNAGADELIAVCVLPKEEEFKLLEGMLKDRYNKEHIDDLVSRQQVIKAVDFHTFETGDGLCLDDDISCILEDLPSLSTQEWIPMVRRDPTDEEKADYFAQHGEELCYMLENEMPLHGQEVLVSVGEFVSEDIFDEDFYNFENNDIENVDAWMPKPAPYRKEVKE